MATSSLRQWGRFAIVTLVGVLLACRQAGAAQRTWIGGNVDWIETAGVDANWNPNFEPDALDEAIFNTANTVDLGTANTIQALTMSGGIDLNTNGQDLTVDGLVQLSDVGTNLIIGGTTSVVQADFMTINASATLEMADGSLQIIDETTSGLLDVNAGGMVTGYGTMSFTDALGAVTSVYTNDGTLSANRTALFGDPPASTLTISLSSANARIDLDGLGGLGAVNVNRNQTLDINGTLLDAFNGTITLRQNATLDISTAWTFAGTLNADNGFVDNIFPISDIPAGKSVIAGGALTQSGGTITVVDTDGELQFDAPFTMNGGNLVNNGLVRFNASTTIAAAANMTMPDNASSITVGVGAVVNINQTNFNLDGAGTTITNVVTVESDGVLNINVSDYDSNDPVNKLDGTITLNSGSIIFNSADAETVMDSTLNMNNLTGDIAGIASWSTGSEPLDIGDDSGSLDANLNVGGTGSVQIAAADIDFNSDADVNIAAGAKLDFLHPVNFNTVNGVNNAEFTGTGTISFTDDVNVNEAVTLNMVGGTVDLDGGDAVGDTINVDAPMTINAASMDSFGHAVLGTNIIDVNNNVGTGVLTVNLDDPAAEWTVNAGAVFDLVNDNAAATLLAGNAVNLNGTVNVTGDVRTTARVDIGSTAVVNINTAGQPFLIDGGNLSTVNTIAGGTINGPGELALDFGRALTGFGTINSDIRFFMTSTRVRADNGMLTIAGAFLGLGGSTGTDDADGILNVLNPWNTSSFLVVELIGGEVRGATITNSSVRGIEGYGLVSSRVINNSLIHADAGNTLVLDTALDNNDWDGAGAGELRASGAGAVLELHDNALTGFVGTVQATGGGRVYANGFTLDYNFGSAIIMSGGTVESSNNVPIGGTVTVIAGADSTIKTGNANLLTFEATSTTTLTGNVRLQSPNLGVQVGATFGGTGAFIIDTSSSAVFDATSNVNVLVINNGDLRPAGFNTVGRVDVKDYQQGATGRLISELTGTALNQFDRLVINGNALLGGTLAVELDGGFVPALGNTFQILSTTLGVSGTFSGYQLPSLGLANSLAVLYNPNNVTLQVIAGLWGDYNQNGVVDAADFVIWRDTLGSAVAALTGADGSGNGIIDQADFDVWRSRFGAVLGPGVGSGNAVPEPATAVLLLLGAAAPLGRRHRSWARGC